MFVVIGIPHLYHSQKYIFPITMWYPMYTFFCKTIIFVYYIKNHRNKTSANNVVALTISVLLSFFIWLKPLAIKISNTNICQVLLLIMINTDKLRRCIFLITLCCYLLMIHFQLSRLWRTTVLKDISKYNQVCWRWSNKLCSKN